MDPLALLFYKSWLLALDDLRRRGRSQCRNEDENAYYGAGRDRYAWVWGLAPLGAIAAFVLIAALIERIGT